MSNSAGKYRTDCYNTYMKNVTIVLLVCALGILGFLLYANEDPATTSTVSTPTESAPAKTTGKEVNLSNKNLDKISKDILDDTSVTILNVSNNNLTGSLPGEIRKLTNLEVLIASDNNMTGIPAEIGQLGKLKVANFANNDLSGLPLELGNLRNLETLDLRGNPDISKHDIALIQKEIPNAQILVD